MEKRVDLSLLSVRTEVSDWLMYHVCVISKDIIVLYSINLS